MFNPLNWCKEGLSLKGKIIIAVLSLIIVIGGGYGAFKFYNFKENNPKFCISCHLMQPAYNVWSKSVHKGLNCHDCHHLSIEDQNKLLIAFILKRPTAVPNLHGRVIVNFEVCITCHWKINPKFKNAKQINRSTMHAVHVFREKFECVQCHGYITHEFKPSARFCVKCHKERTVHGTGMEGLACLNCHTDRTPTLLPGRKKCLFCHGGERIRKELIADGTLDVRNFMPSPQIIKKATKIDVPKDAPMQFDCYQCHKPHKNAVADWSNCLTCHSNIMLVGQHKRHIQDMGLQCKQCHRPHAWKVSKQVAKKVCVTCHEYRDPMRFLK